MESSALVQRWIEAHNDRDIEAMLACVAEDFEFHPLRFVEGAKTSFVGRDELRLWFSRLKQGGSGHELHLSQLEERGPNEVLVVGTIQLPGSSSVADFYGVYEVSDGLIRRATHYISDRQTLERLGLIPAPES